MDASLTSQGMPADLEDILLFVGCGDWPVGIEGRMVRRLAMSESVQLNTFEINDPANPSELPGLLGYCRCDGQQYAAWDMGAMLEIHSSQSAWVLIGMEWRGCTLSLALRTGPAMGFVRADAGHVLGYAPRLSRRRPGAVAGVFSARLVPSRIRSGARLGVKVDLSRLWTPAELDAITAATSSVAQTGGR